MQSQEGIRHGQEMLAQTFSSTSPQPITQSLQSTWRIWSQMLYVVRLLFNPWGTQYQLLNGVAKPYGRLRYERDVDIVSREVEWKERGKRSLLLPDL